MPYSLLENAGRPQRKAYSLLEGATPKTAGGYSLLDGDDTQSRIAALEAQLAAEGSAIPGGSGIVRGLKGATGRVVDILSRPNYAVAGAVEELFSGGAMAPARAGGRILSELFSGLPGVEGQKRGFGEVLERAGAPMLGSLSDIAPVLFSETGEGWRLQRGGWADPTGRGTVGLALDIVTDPLTYVTFGGAGAVRRLLPRAGVKFLSPLGLEKVKQVEAAFKPAFDAAMSLTDDTLRMNALRQARAEMDNAVEAALVDTAGKPLDKALFDPGGVKLFGQSVVKAETLSKVAEPVRSALLAVPGGDKALEGAAAFHDGARAFFNGLFAWSGQTANLPPGMRAAAERIIRERVAANGAIQGRIFRQVNELEKEFADVLKAEPNLGKWFTDIREGTGAHTLSQRQQDLFNRFFGLYDEMEANGLALGVLDPEQVARFHGRYIHHKWANAEDLSEVAQQYGRPGFAPRTSERFQRERAFETIQDGVDASTQAHAIGMMQRRAGETVAVYPVLEPDYDIFKNLRSYVYQHADAISRKWMYDDAIRLFGKLPSTEVKPEALFDIMHKIPVPVAEAERIGLFFSESNFNKMAEAIGEKDWVAAWPDLKATALRQIGTLSQDGQREFFREMFTRIRSPWQFAHIVNDFPQYRSIMPKPLAVTQGSVEPYLAHFGEQAKYVSTAGRSSKLWGEKPVLVPELFANEVEGASAEAWKWMKANGIKEFIDGWDWTNNWFKIGVYTPWPGSLVRDLYNNVLQAGLDISFGAMARPLQSAKIIARMNPAEVLSIGQHALTQDQWYRLAVDLNVVDESGRMFVQMTGTQQPAAAGKMAKALAIRSKPENWSRIQLWVNNIARGLDPRDAADKVKDYLFDYSELSRPERELFRRAVPFYTFPRKAIALHVDALRRTPGRVINEVKPFRGRESEDAQMISWESEAFKLRLNRDGKTLTVLSGVDLPIKSMDTLWRGNPRDTVRMMGGMLSPLLKAPIEMMTGKDLFTNREILRRQAPAVGRFLDATNSPQWLKTYVGYRKEHDAAGRPVYTVDNTSALMVLARSWAFSRVFTMSDRQFREYFAGDPQVAASLLDILTNLRFKEMDLTVENERMLKERLRMLEDAATRLGLLREFRTTYPAREGAAR